MKTALIGYTGFVGSNILSSYDFDQLYNSKNIEDIRGNSFDLLVCAGVPAIKWWANNNKSEDLEIILSLIDVFKSIKVKRFVLISTVDVYNLPDNVNENSDIDTNDLCPYGKHRFMLENEVAGLFEHVHIIRLPALFGDGLKKNIIYDMLNENILEKINLESSFQWYPLSRVWRDIEIVIDNDLSVVNFAVEPIKTSVIKDKFFSKLIVGKDPNPQVAYDMKTLNSNLFCSCKEGYILSAEEVIESLADWLKKIKECND